MPSKDLIIARPVSLICRGIAPLSALTGLLSLRENPPAAFAADLQPDSREFSAPPPNQPTGSLLRRRPFRRKWAGQARLSRTKNERLPERERCGSQSHAETTALTIAFGDPNRGVGNRQ